MTPRDPHRRRRILDATRALIPRHGIAGITHRLVAAEAGVPVGSTTYYFADLADLTETALAETAAATREALAEWAGELARGTDLPATLSALVAGYLDRPEQMLTVNELYLAATRHPELRPLARVWFDGLVDILTPHTGIPAARAIAMYLDGVLLHALSSDSRLDTTALIAPLSALAALDDEPPPSG
ncbi:TetR/AcrR family transcriptional regulator [Nocardia carnea]|uniref:TetR/AcrR family transcriptional regulator n=1 Tax=Nocardia carnea TaxID=37328 RepID=UPI00245434E8|nr:TetR family transcriptional regulator [Nocardia carnea]